MQAYIPSWSVFGWNEWGFDDDPVPERTEFFNTDSNLGIEDFFQHNEVFKNGIRNTPCHMDSYMTVVDFSALDRALRILEENFQPTLEEWKIIIERWDSDPNTQLATKWLIQYLKNNLN